MHGGSHTRDKQTDPGVVAVRSHAAHTRAGHEPVKDELVHRNDEFKRDRVQQQFVYLRRAPDVESAQNKQTARDGKAKRIGPHREPEADIANVDDLDLPGLGVKLESRPNFRTWWQIASANTRSVGVTHNRRERLCGCDARMVTANSSTFGSIACVCVHVI